MPGGPPSRHRTSSTAGGSSDLRSRFSSSVLTTGLITGLPTGLTTGLAAGAAASSRPSLGWLDTVDNLQHSVDNQAELGALPAAGCGQTTVFTLRVYSPGLLSGSADGHGQERN